MIENPCPFCGGEWEPDPITHWTGMQSVIVAHRFRHHCKAIPGQWEGSRCYIEITGKTLEDVIANVNRRTP